MVVFSGAVTSLKEVVGLEACALGEVHKRRYAYG